MYKLGENIGNYNNEIIFIIEKIFIYLLDIRRSFIVFLIFCCKVFLLVSSSSNWVGDSFSNMLVILLVRDWKKRCENIYLCCYGNFVDYFLLFSIG